VALVSKREMEIKKIIERKVRCRRCSLKSLSRCTWMNFNKCRPGVIEAGGRAETDKRNKADIRGWGGSKNYGKEKTSTAPLPVVSKN